MKLIDQQADLNVYFLSNSDCLTPLTATELANLEIPMPISAQQLWLPDGVKFAANEWLHQTSGSAEATKRYHSVVRQFQQSGSKPYPFLRVMEQIRPDLYPYWQMKDCELFFVPQRLRKEGISKDHFQSFWHKREFENVREWLLKLPLHSDEKVYIARDPAETLVLTWGLFANHWDCFYSDNFVCLNIVDDNPEWYLFFHPEQVIIYGCTASFVCPSSGNYMPTSLQQASFYEKFARITGSERNAKYTQSVDMFMSCG